MEIQRNIIDKLAKDKDLSQFKKLNFYKSMAKMTRPYFWNFTAPEISNILTARCLSPDSDRKASLEYRRKLPQIHAYVTKNPVALKELSVLLSTIDLQATLVDFQKHQQYRYTGLMDFLLRHKIFLPLSIPPGLSQYRNVFIKDLFQYPAHSIAQLLLKNIANGRLRSEGSLDIILQFLEKKHLELLNIENKHQIILYTLKQAMLIYSALSKENQRRYEALFIEYYLTFSSRILEDLIPMLSRGKTLSLLGQIFKNLSAEDWLRHWIEVVSLVDRTAAILFIPETPTIARSLWTDMQQNIFRFIYIISNENFSPEEKLKILERLFDYVYSNQKNIYPLRHATFDSIGTFLGKGEKISKHGFEQLAVIREAAFNYLKMAKQNKPEILEPYFNKSIFKAHRERGFFNKWRETSHQKLIRQEINRLTSASPALS